MPSAYDFREEAADLFGLDMREAIELREMLADAYAFDYREQTLADYAEEAADLIDFIPSFAEAMEEEADEWLEPGVWYEITGEYEET